MDQLLYVYDEENDKYKALNILSTIGSVRQICQGNKPNTYQILSETGCLYYLTFEQSFYQIPCRNEKLKLIATNSFMTLAISYLGTLYSFGEDTQQLGLLGIPKIYYSANPVKIGVNFKSVSISEEIASGMDYLGKLWIWGQTPLGRYEEPEVFKPNHENKIIQHSSGKDYVVLIDAMCKILILLDSFKLTTSYYNSQKWILHKVKQFESEHLVITEIIPGEKQTFFITVKQQLYALLCTGDQMVLRRVPINVKVLHAHQSERYLYVFTESRNFIRIDKGNLYSNEQQEIKQIYEQTQMQKDDDIHRIIQATKPIYSIKNYPNSIPAFVYCPAQYQIPEKTEKLQSPLKYMSPQKYTSPFKYTSPYKFTTPTPKKDSFLASQNLDSLNKGSKTLNRLQTKSPNLNGSSNMKRSFISQVNSPVRTSHRNVNNLLKKLERDAGETARSPQYNYTQSQVIQKDRVSSIRACSSTIESVFQLVKDFGPKTQSQEKERIQNVLKKKTQYDVEIQKSMQQVRSKLNVLENSQPKRTKNNSISNVLNQSTISQTDQNQISVSNWKPQQQPEQLQAGLQIKQDSMRTSVLQSEDEGMEGTEIQKQFWAESAQETNVYQKQVETYIQEEIIIINQKTGKQVRKLIRRPLIYSQDKLELGDNLQIPGKKGELIVSRQIISCDLGIEQMIQQGWCRRTIGTYEQIISEGEPTQFIEEEVLVMNSETGQRERKLIRRPVTSAKDTKVQMGANLEEYDQQGNIVVSRKMVENIDSAVILQKQGWSKSPQGQLYRTLSQVEPEQYIEEEVLIVNPKTGKQERKIVRKPYFEDVEQDVQIGDNIKEIGMNGERILSRKVVTNAHSTDLLQQEGWNKKKDGTMERQLVAAEPTQFIEEEVLVMNSETGQRERKLIRRPVTSAKDTKVQMGANLKEQDQQGYIVVSRKIVDNLDSAEFLQKQGWSKSPQGQLYRTLSQVEPEQYIEEEVLIVNPKTGKQERKIVRKPYFEDVEQDVQIGDNIKEIGMNGERILSRKVVTNAHSTDLLQQEGWNKKKDGTMERQLVAAEPTQFIEEEVLVMNSETGQRERKLIRRPVTSAKDTKVQMGANLEEQDQQGNIVVSRKIVDNLDSAEFLQKQGWSKSPQGQLYRTLSQVEPEQYIEEEVLIVNPKTGKQERKIVRKPYFEDEEQDVQIGDNIKEIGMNGERILSRKVVTNAHSTDLLQQEGWNKKKDGTMERQLVAAEPTQFIEEEVLVMNSETGQRERKLIRRPVTSAKDTKVQMGANLEEQDQQGNIVVSRKIVDNLDSAEFLQKQGWSKSPQGQLYRTLSQVEPEQYIEEEILIVNPKTGKQERKIVRKPYFEDEEQDVQLGDNIKEIGLNGERILSRKVVTNAHSTDLLQQEGWNKKKDGTMERQLVAAEPTQFIEEEVLVMNSETGQRERKLIRRPVTSAKDTKVQMGANLEEQDQQGNIVVSRKILDNLDSAEFLQKQGWSKSPQGQLYRTLSQVEPEQYIEEEVLIVNPKTGKQERKIVRKPYFEDEEQDVQIGDNIKEIGMNGERILSRKVVTNAHSTDLLQQEGWNKKKDGTMERQLVAAEPTQFIEEEVLVMNSETGQRERKLIRRPVTSAKDTKVQMGVNLEEQDQQGNIVVSRKIVENLDSAEFLQKQGWSKSPQGQLYRTLSQVEPVQYIEEEVLIVNSKTGKQERKIVRKPYFEDEEQDVQIGDNIKEIGMNGERILSRKVVTNAHSTDLLQQEGWSKKKDGTMERQLVAAEPTQFIEEEVLVMNSETGQRERKLIRRPVTSAKDTKVQMGANLEEQDQQGNIVVSRKIVDNLDSAEFLQKQGWSKSPQGQLYRTLSQVEPEQYIEEELLIVNPKTGKQERKIVRKPYFEDEEQDVQIGDNIKEIGMNGERILSRKVVTNAHSTDLLQQEGWNKKKDGTMERQLVAAEPTQFIEEEVLVMNSETGQRERKLIRRPVTSAKDTKVQMGANLEEQDQQGNIVVSRKIVDNLDSAEFLQKQGWSKSPQGQLYRTLSQVEPEQYIEEEILIVNPKTGKQERKIVRKPYFEDEEQDVQIGDNIKEIGMNGERILSRKVVTNAHSTDLLQQEGWNKKKDGTMERQLVAAEPTQFIEEEVLVMNSETGQRERKLIRRPVTSAKDTKVQMGANLEEQDQQGNIVVSRKIVDNLDSAEFLQKQGWSKSPQGQLYRTLSQVEPEQYIEEEVLIVNPKTGKQERKIVRKPYFEDEEQDVQIGDNIKEIGMNGERILSRKVVTNAHSTDLLQQEGWSKKKDGTMERQLVAAEPTQFIEEEVLVMNSETGQRERKLIRRPVTSAKDTKVQMGANLEEQDQQGNIVVSRKIVDNLDSAEFLQKQGWSKSPQGQLYRTLSQVEPEQYIEEEILIVNPKTGKQERKIVRKPYFEDEEQDVQIGDNIKEIGMNGERILSRKVVTNAHSTDLLQQEGWNKKKDGTMERQLVAAEPTQFIEEEVLVMNSETGQRERKLIRRPVTSAKDTKVQMGANLEEQDQQGNIVVSRKIVENLDSAEFLQKQGWSKSPQGQLYRTLSQVEPVQYIEEEVLIVNPKTGKQERKIVRKPYFEDEEQDVQLGDNIKEIGMNGERILSRKVVTNAHSTDLLQQEGWNKKKDGTMERQLVAAEPTQFIEEEVLVMNSETGQRERKLIRRPVTSVKDTKVQMGVNLEEQDQQGNIVVSRKIVENLDSAEFLQKQGWSKSPQGQLYRTLSQVEPVQYIEEEVLIVNPKTGKQERKIVRKPYFEDEEQDVQLGDNIKEIGLNGERILSRKVVTNAHSTDLLQQEGWNKKKDGTMERQLVAAEPTQFIEEEVLVLNSETGQRERKLIRRPVTSVKDTKVQMGANLEEQDQQGNIVVSRKIVDNLDSAEFLQKQGWSKSPQGQLYRTLSQVEPEQYIEEEVLIVNPKTGKQERKIVRKPYFEDEEQDVQIGDNIKEIGMNGERILSRKVVTNAHSTDLLQQEGWNKKKDGTMERQLVAAEPTQFIEEEVLVMNSETGQRERKLIRRPVTSAKDTKVQMGANLEEQDQQGNIVISRKIVDNLDSAEFLQKQGWSKSPQGQLYRTLSQVEPEQYIEEEVLIVNPKTGKQERKIVRKPYFEDEEQDVQIGDNIKEIGMNGERILSRKVVTNAHSTDLLQQEGWNKKKDGTMERQLVAAEPTQFIEEEVLVMNSETGQRERKLIRRPVTSAKDTKVQMGANLEEQDQQGNIVVSRKIVDNLDSAEFLQKQGWSKSPQGQLYRTLSQVEPEQYIEEEVLIVNPKTGKQERKIVRKPYFEDEEQDVQIGDNIKEIGMNGERILSRKVVTNAHSTDLLQQEGWNKKKDGTMERQLVAAEPTQFIEEEVLVMNSETGQRERKLIRRPVTSVKDTKVQMGANLEEQDQQGNIVVSRKIVDNLDSAEFLQKQGWSKSPQGQLYRTLSQVEPEQYIEEEVLIVNPKTGKQERKIVRKPYFEDEEQDVQIGDNIKEIGMNGERILSRKVVTNAHSTDLLQQEGWNKKKDGTMERQLVAAEPTQFIEEEVLVMNSETGQRERKLIRRPVTSAKDTKVQMGHNLEEQDSEGNIIVSRKIVDNNDSTSTLFKQTWCKLQQGQLSRTLSQSEPDQYIEEKILIVNPNTGVSQLKIIRRIYQENEEIGQIGENLQEFCSNGEIVMSRKIVFNRQSIEQIKSEGWSMESDGTIVKFQIVDQPINLSGANSEVWKSVYERGQSPQQLKSQFQRIQGRRSMQQIDEDSQEQRDSQYKSADDQNQDNKIKIVEFDSPRLKDQRQLFESDKKNETFKILVEEEVLQKNPVNSRIERKLIRRLVNKGQVVLSDNLQEQDGDMVILSRVQAANRDQSELLFQGWVEVKPQVMQKIISKNDSYQLVEEEVLIIDGFGQVKSKEIRRRAYKEADQLKCGEVNEKQANNNNILVNRRIITNCALAYMLGNEFKKQKDGTYVKTIPLEAIERQTLISIPKYVELAKDRYSADHLQGIMNLEQKQGKLSSDFGQSQIEKDQFLFQEHISKIQNPSIDFQTIDQRMFDDVMVNRTNYSDISETDKMFLKQLDRKESKQQSKKIGWNEEGRYRITSEKLNKSLSSKFSDSFDQEFSLSKPKLMAIKVLVRFVKKVSHSTLLDGVIEIKQKANYTNGSTKLVKLISFSIPQIQRRNLSYGFMKIFENQLFYNKSKNINTIEFNEDDVKKYNQMLTENKIMQMNSSGMADVEQQAEPVELQETPTQLPMKQDRTQEVVGKFNSYSKYFNQKVPSTNPLPATNPQPNIEVNKTPIKSSSQINISQNSQQKLEQAKSLGTRQVGHSQTIKVQTPQPRQGAKSQTIKIQPQSNPKSSVLQSQQPAPKVSQFSSNESRQVITRQGSTISNSSKNNAPTQVSQRSIRPNDSQKIATPTKSSVSNITSQNISQVSIPTQVNPAQTSILQQQKAKIAMQFKKISAPASNSYKPKK